MSRVSHSLLVFIGHTETWVRFAHMATKCTACLEAAVAELALERLFFIEVSISLAASVICAVVTQHNFWRGLNIVRGDCSLKLLRIFIDDFVIGYGLEGGWLPSPTQLWLFEILLSFKLRIAREGWIFLPLLGLA